VQTGLAQRPQNRLCQKSNPTQSKHGIPVGAGMTIFMFLQVSLSGFMGVLKVRHQQKTWREKQAMRR
jgi:hypothetical protein